MRRWRLDRWGAYVRGCAILAVCLAAHGCGYTARSLLPSDMKTIYVENFANKIPISEPTSDMRMYRGYRPRMEFDVTKAIVDRFLYDGSLKVVSTKDADLILNGELIDYVKEPLRYDRDNNIEEYRVRLVTDLRLTDTKKGVEMWHEKGFAGETTFRTGGSLAKDEASAVNDVAVDLARRVVERTIEGW